MAIKLFGWEISKEPTPQYPTFTPAEKDDGAVVIQQGGSGFFGSQFVDLEGLSKNEAELIAKYREMALTPEIECAVDDVVNEAIVKEGNEHIVNLNLDDLEQPPEVKVAIEKEWKNVLELFNFNNEGYEIFKRWYVDGRIYYHCIIDEKNPREGIKELRYIDPRKLRKIRVVKEKKQEVQTSTQVNGQSPLTITQTVSEFYLFTGKTYSKNASMGASPASTYMNTNANAGLQIAKDAIIYCSSGMVDKDNKMVLSYLHKAIKPLNMLRMLEDASVIYFLTRSPERKVFYIDVGNLPKMKAEQHLKDMMTRHKNRIVYDAATGEINSDRKFMTMQEDYWMPRRGDGKATEITTLQGGTQLSQLLENLVYFRSKLYKSMNVPASRMNDDDGFALGRATEINRDELKFQKFINRIRLRFGYNLLLAALEKQLILKGICTADDWEKFRSEIHLEYNSDNYFSELKDSEVLKDRLTTLQMIDPYLGRFYSNDWAMRNILKMTNEDIEQNKAMIEQEKAENPDAFPTLNQMLAPPPPPFGDGGEEGPPPQGDDNQFPSPQEGGEDVNANPTINKGKKPPFPPGPNN